jgi:uncharacterized phage protein (TIGR02220 family)
MAERRMFAKTIIDSDAFLDMPLSTQALYFHLAMRADDEGFVNNPKKIARMICADDDSLKLLIVKKFIIPFDSGIVVIKHWRIHNYIQKDRFKETVYKEERQQITVKDNGAYTLNMKPAGALYPDCVQDVSKPDTQDSIGKVSIGNNSFLSVCDAKQTRENEKRKNEIEEIVKYLNQKTGAKYRATTENTKKHINARLDEGYSVDDFKTVIDKKCSEWMNTPYRKFLRPETLFRPANFEAYLNQQIDEREVNYYAGIDADTII